MVFRRIRGTTDFELRFEAGPPKNNDFPEGKHILRMLMAHAQAESFMPTAFCRTDPISLVAYGPAILLMWAAVLWR